MQSAGIGTDDVLRELREDADHGRGGSVIVGH